MELLDHFLFLTVLVCSNSVVVKACGGPVGQDTASADEPDGSNSTVKQVSTTINPLKCPISQGYEWFMNRGRCYIPVPSAVYNLNRDTAEYGCTTQTRVARLARIDDEEERAFIEEKVKQANNWVTENLKRPHGGYWLKGKNDHNCDFVEVENGEMIVKSAKCYVAKGFICEVEAELRE